MDVLTNELSSCASEDDSSQWGSRVDIAEMLQEILLSYRLLFGQNKKSRRLFKSLRGSTSDPSITSDPLLSLLCCKKNAHPSTVSVERASYRLRRDFPILRSRLAILQQHLLNTKPRTWKEIWMDKRDSPQWYTFWTVLIFGLVALVLALIQVILQAVQLAQG